MPPRKNAPSPSGAAFFSLENLGQLCGIEDNIAFAGELIDSYGKRAKADSSSKSPWGRFRAALGEIERRHADKKLNLAVVGEFSTGKSTFVNALLRQQLLVSSVLQGTTVACTVIEQGCDCVIDASFLGRKKSLRETFSDPADMKGRLAGLTTDETVARQLKTVRVTLPSEGFAPDVRIIDTPGTNAIEAWHEDVTIRAIREQADVSVILLAADRLVTNTVLSFVGKHLRPLLEQSVFVVTHMDHIETEKERERQLAYIRLKIANELDLEKPVVLPYSSTVVLDSAQGLPVPEDMRRLLEDSLASERALHDHMTRVRMIAQTKRLVRLLESLYGEIQLHFEKSSAARKEELAALEKSKKTDLGTFVDFHKNLVKEDLEEKIRVELDGAETKIERSFKNGADSILEMVGNQPDINSLKTCLGNRLLSRFKAETDKGWLLATECRDAISRTLRSELEQFYGAFANEYRQQGIVELALSFPVMPPLDVTAVDVADFSASIQYAASQLEKELGNRVRGGLVGGGIGFLAGGPWGALAGAWIGERVAKFFSMGEVVPKWCCQYLSGELANSFMRFQKCLASSMQSFANEAIDQSSALIDQYHATYRKAIQRLIASQEAKIRAAQTKLDGLRRDSDAVLERKNRLDAVRKRLDALSKQVSKPQGTPQ